MKVAPKLPPASERFLARAATLTLEQWTTIYWQFVERPEILKAARKVDAVVSQALLNDLRATPVGNGWAKRDPVIMERNARIAQIVLPLPEDELDPERGGHLRQRVSSIIAETDNALRRAELVNADPVCHKAVRRFLSIFEGLIDFPEFT